MKENFIKQSAFGIACIKLQSICKSLLKKTEKYIKRYYS